ncbi:hypothetical protein ENSA5_66970 [Enhygromyxa salina]|uniref:Uncharacterized protein n=1 Tax=Enhygromyxa salina TaxID=215803 RepID=A0A2S9XBE8_9BACT|nr:hypothetical protein [Enhygromyxa salina]PRP90175.1 hypothetical protein ENSA5_66970 [Enhygromyxa salina]
MTAEAQLTIPPPRADRPPLKTNLLHTMQQANTALAPLFPYLHPGAIVATGALFIGDTDKDYGQFYHHNTVDEVIIAFVAQGGNLKTGQLYNGGRVHGVNSFLKDQTSPGTFAVFTITQRQLDEGEQSEAISLLCTKCRKQLLKETYDSTSVPDAHELDHPFVTPLMSAEAFRAYNEDPERRRCPDCGHVNEPFPVHAWGWDLYATQSTTMTAAKQILLEAGGKEAS